MSSHQPPPNFPSRRELHQRGASPDQAEAYPVHHADGHRPQSSNGTRGWHELPMGGSNNGESDVLFSANQGGQPRRRKIWRAVRTICVLLLVIALVGFGLLLAFKEFHVSGDTDDYSGPGTGMVSVTVEPNDTGSAIGKKLQQLGVVKTSTAFSRAFEANPSATSIRPGTYTLKEHMASVDALSALLNDENRTENAITVVPGATYWQIEDQLKNVAHFSTQDIHDAVNDTVSLGLPASAKGKIEGWLLPGSYEFGSNDTPTSILIKMVSGRKTQLQQLKVPETNWETVLIKASIVEREVHLDDYYPKAARVIENRLDHPEGETRGRLQMDSTVLYGLHRTGGIPTSAEVQDPTNPYNTYQHDGLPPSPISTPSEKAIQAVLHPQPGSWLYFVTVNLDTGETLFASTSDEQQQNVKKLNEYCSTHSDKCNK